MPNALPRDDGRMPFRANLSPSQPGHGHDGRLRGREPARSYAPICWPPNVSPSPVVNDRAPDLLAHVPRPAVRQAPAPDVRLTPMRELRVALPDPKPPKLRTLACVDCGALVTCPAQQANRQRCAPCGQVRDRERRAERARGKRAA